MPLSKLSELSYRWLIAELSVVILGILIAFQVDAWRISISDRTEERVALSGIRDDLVADFERLDDVLQLETATLEALDSLARYLQNSQPRSAETLARLFQTASRFTTYSPRSPSYISLRSSGRIAIIEQQSMRNSIFEYFETTQPSLGSFLANHREAWNLFHYSALQDMYVATEGHAGPNTEIIKTGVQGRIAVVSPLSEIPRNPEFLGYLGRYGARLQNSIGQIKRVQAENLDLQEQITAFLVEDI